MSAGCALHPAYSSLFVQTTSIPGLQDASKIGPLVKQTVIPGGGRGKSNTIAYEDLFVKIQETADLTIVKFLSWLQKSSGDLATATIIVQDANNKDVLKVELEGLEITNVSSLSLSMSDYIGSDGALDYDVTFRVGRVKYVVL
jgi:hypothetical protein